MTDEKVTVVPHAPEPIRRRQTLALKPDLHLRSLTARCRREMARRARVTRLRARSAVALKTVFHRRHVSPPRRINTIDIRVAREARDACTCMFLVGELNVWRRHNGGTWFALVTLGALSDHLGSARIGRMTWVATPLAGEKVLLRVGAICRTNMTALALLRFVCVERVVEDEPRISACRQNDVGNPHGTTIVGASKRVAGRQPTERK